jgi:hypothetical protein
MEPLPLKPPGPLATEKRVVEGPSLLYGPHTPQEREQIVHAYHAAHVEVAEAAIARARAPVTEQNQQVVRNRPFRSQ